MLTIGELSIFLTEELYLLPGEVLDQVKDIPEPDDEVLTGQDTDFEEIPVIREKPTYKAVLFITDKKMTGVAAETFKNLVDKALNLSEKDYTLITQEEVNFTKPSDVDSIKIILFGSSFTGFQQKYKVHSADNKLILCADSMERIAANQELKKQLWVQLKIMFPR